MSNPQRGQSLRWRELLAALVGGVSEVLEAFREQVTFEAGAVEGETFHFERAEQDVCRLRGRRRQEGWEVHDTHLDVEEVEGGYRVDFLLLLRRRGRTERQTLSLEVRRLAGLPAEVADELKKSGRVRLLLHLDEAVADSEDVSNGQER